MPNYEHIVINCEAQTPCLNAADITGLGVQATTAGGNIRWDVKM